MTHVVADFAATLGGVFLQLLFLLSGKFLTGGIMGRQDAEPEAELVCQKLHVVFGSYPPVFLWVSQS